MAKGGILLLAIILIERMYSVNTVGAKWWIQSL